MRMNTVRWAALPATAALLLMTAGCGSDVAYVGSNPVGTWGSEAQGQPNLTLAEDGTMSGSDGCNRLTANWKKAKSGVTFTPIASTLMACQGVDTWLKGAVSASVTGTTMTVKGAGGNTIGTLKNATK